MSNLVKHAKKELELAGLFDKDSDYNGMVGDAVLELVKVFSKQGHSGFSANWVLDIFDKVARYQNLTPIGKSKDEWMNVSDMSSEPMWQNTRRGTTFSRDGGKTWYDIDDPKLNNGDVWCRTKLQRLVKRITSKRTVDHA
jgi:hypothetical protein